MKLKELDCISFIVVEKIMLGYYRSKSGASDFSVMWEPRGVECTVWLKGPKKTIKRNFQSVPLALDLIENHERFINAMKSLVDVIKMTPESQDEHQEEKTA